jgi:hypothetical protein
MAKLLRSWVRSETLWPVPREKHSRSAKGHKRAKFERLWEIYCPQDRHTPPDSGTAAQHGNVRYLGGR